MNHDTYEAMAKVIRAEVRGLRARIRLLEEENERLRQQRDAANAMVKLLEDALRNL